MGTSTTGFSEAWKRGGKHYYPSEASKIVEYFISTEIIEVPPYYTRGDTPFLQTETCSFIVFIGA